VGLQWQKRSDRVTSVKHKNPLNLHAIFTRSYKRIYLLSSTIETRLKKLLDSGQQGLLKHRLIGLEKESLRVSVHGTIAQTSHPDALGSTLTHPHITTDYSEALLELVTPPLPDIHQTLRFLQDTHQFVYSRLENQETLWATSMPCVLEGEEGIPIAHYGNSNLGLMKHIYRRGLAHRYGGIMQVIAGVHFNYSFSEKFWPVYQELEGDKGHLRDFIDNSYFGLIRNLQRFGWLIPYLFGASPAVCKSFLQDHRPRNLQPFDDSTYYGAYATSLRMGDIGYQNKKEDSSGVKVCYNNLNTYTSSLQKATSIACPEYKKIGVLVDGEYRQLNPYLLQIENEYYSSVRPKQILQGNEKPSNALRQRGVRYIELRSLDVNAYDPLGINEEQLHFLEIFIIFCLLQDSPSICGSEAEEINLNQSAAAHQGRDPSLMLRRQGRSQLLRTWASELCHSMRAISEILDEGEVDQPYSKALENQLQMVHETDRTPSARMLEEMRDTREGFFEFSNRLSHKHARYFQKLTPQPQRETEFVALAEKSKQEQQAIEAADQIPFADYLKNYFDS